MLRGEFLALTNGKPEAVFVDWNGLLLSLEKRGILYNHHLPQYVSALISKDYLHAHKVYGAIEKDNLATNLDMSEASFVNIIKSFIEKTRETPTAYLLLLEEA